MVPRRKGAKAPLFCPVAQQPVPLTAGAFLNRRRRLLGPSHGQHAVRNAEPFADGRDHARFVATFRAETVIDGGGFNLAWPQSHAQEQERKAVRTAGDGNANALSGLDQTVEIVTKAIE